MLIIDWFIHCPTKFIPVNSVAIELHVIVNITLVCKLELRYRKETFSIMSLLIHFSQVIIHFTISKTFWLKKYYRLKLKS